MYCFTLLIRRVSKSEDIMNNNKVVEYKVCIITI